MKKIVNKLKQNAKIITAFVLGAILTGGTVYAATVLPSSQVGYDNSASGLAATDVQGALDELYTRANTWIDASKDYSSSHPVSYTHLDVYKRQETTSQDLFILRINHIQKLNKFTRRIMILFGELIGEQCACLLYTSRCV